MRTCWWQISTLLVGIFKFYFYLFPSLLNGVFTKFHYFGSLKQLKTQHIVALAVSLANDPEATNEKDI